MPLTRRMLIAGLSLGAGFASATFSRAQTEATPFKVVAFAGASN